MYHCGHVEVTKHISVKHWTCYIGLTTSQLQNIHCTSVHADSAMLLVGRAGRWVYLGMFVDVRGQHEYTSTAIVATHPTWNNVTVCGAPRESMAYFLFMFDVCGCGTVDIHSSALGDSDDQHHLFHLNDEITIHFLLRFHWRESGGDYWVTRSVARRPWKSIICLPLLWPIQLCPPWKNTPLHYFMRFSSLMPLQRHCKMQ